MSYRAGNNRSTRPAPRVAAALYPQHFSRRTGDHGHPVLIQRSICSAESQDHEGVVQGSLVEPGMAAGIAAL